MKIEQIKIDFNVMPEIKRFVYVYLFGTADVCYLVDSGVAGCEAEIESRMARLGFAPENLKGIFFDACAPGPHRHCELFPYKVRLQGLCERWRKKVD